MKIYYFLFVIFLVTNNVTAQKQGTSTDKSFREIPIVTFPILDNNKLLTKELTARGANRTPHFAVSHNTNISTATHGQWDTLATNLLRWQLRVKSPDAFSLNLGFSIYEIPVSGQLFLHTPNETSGPFSLNDNESHEQFWSPILPGDEIRIEVRLAPEDKNLLRLQLNAVNHDFVNIRNSNSGNCNLDVICSANDNWNQVDNYRDIIRSVGLITVNGTGLCTGFLVNNHQQDCRPYFMTADHCEIGILAAPSVVVYWNYENSFCRQPSSEESGNPGDGMFSIFNSGSVLRANYQPTDMTLLELDDPVVEEANAFFAGWDATDEVPQSAIAIHHPAAEEKRISFEEQALFISSAFDDNPNPGGTHLLVSDWDIGTTEQGSSGCPLFDQDKRAVGQLHGGNAACGNDEADWFGRLAVSWTGDNTPESRLKDWLDPEDTGILTLDGREQNLCLSSDFAIITAQDFYENCFTAPTNISLTVGAAFSNDVTLSATGNPAGTTVSFSQNPVPPGSNILATIDHVDFTGNYALSFQADDGENQSETSVDVQATDLPGAINLSAPGNQDDGVSLSPSFSWTTGTFADVYVFMLATDPDFSTILINETVTENTFTPIFQLDYNTSYYWKVDVFNECGASQMDVPFSFTTVADLSINIFPEVLQACTGAFLNFNITINEGFTAPVQLELGAFPGNGIPTFSENPAQPSTTVSAHISNMLFATPGDYNIPLQLSDGTTTIATDLSLIILGGPEGTTLLSPANEALEVSIQPTISWMPVAEISQYTLFVSNNENFSDLAFSTTTQNSNYIVSNSLNPGNWYYWRVLTQNNCGSTLSESFRFKVAGTSSNIDAHKASIIVYPNPSKGVFYLVAPAPFDYQLEVFSLDGRSIPFQKESQGNDLLAISLATTETGVFILKLSGGDEVRVMKIMVRPD